MRDNFEKLREIDAERSDILSKLKKIEEKKSTVSAEVYEKVMKDYEEKLKKVDEKLLQNVELIKLEFSRLEERESFLLQDEKQIRLNLEEIELRYSIGEYDDEKYHAMCDENKVRLAKITEEREKIAERKKWLGGFLQIEATEKRIEPVGEEILKIDEHILEEKLPDELEKLEELLAEDTKSAASRPVAEETQKGILCPKCGFVNAPDSWYCEKCGAEILSSPIL